MGWMNEIAMIIDEARAAGITLKLSDFRREGDELKGTATVPTPSGMVLVPIGEQCADIEPHPAHVYAAGASKRDRSGHYALCLGH